MSNNVDERLIQRCVDNEISGTERQLLLQQLEAAPEEWKTLACTYMEEQLFAAAVVDSDRQAAAKLSPAMLPVADKRHWFHHPLTSVALSACVAFLLGTLISGRFKEVGDAPEPGVGIASFDQAPKGEVATEESHPTTVGTLTSDRGRYRVQFEADGDMLQEVPVFDDESLYFSEYELRQQSLWKALAKELDASEGVSPEVKFIRLPTKDGRFIVVPVEYFSVSPRFQ